MRHVGRLLALLALALLCLQLWFAGRILLMRFVAPQSTSFQRSEIVRLLGEKHQVSWSQQWVDDAQLPATLKRAVIASEDDGFAEHGGVDWDALKGAWKKNEKAQARVEARGKGVAKVVGGSTITQQLAKNLFLSGERTLLRKGQELVITLMLEGLLDKRRILEIYLNNVEWGEGLFGAQAAARHYFRVDAARLGPFEAARLAVMLPAPKRFERQPGSPYVMGRAGLIVGRMNSAELP
ncbi:monofunctional biosynthetic peptidoglycan transglycosylase [Roseateles saccharophilus]|uniref:Biosynthetic peptidoglycan transglycosylase n=1 Tax=Roseateles saccharophilus TaxID=304 RepID=A0A4R3V5D6_ROSSA|nr:monofunctional biosynthetic peptidoglycan transglycosylase [Roseateles saccharophilus]MDG0836133.1 monofunctional biosynthetic peptidoglycan transglycosylase [Roseateles saccharophilus]TCU98771.1 monofunctional biosynthetic peptidoglycan transglycosylase [Roseateles saccharophilus]